MPWPLRWRTTAAVGARQRMKRVDLLAYNWLIHWVNNRAFRRSRNVLAGRVVDLGCGSAPFKGAILASGLVREYVGVDWEQSLHDPSQVDISADLRAPLPIADGWADTVVCFQVLEHLPEPSRFLAECHRILRTGGQVLLTVPFMWHLHEEPCDYFRYTRYGLQHLLGKAGFRDVRVEANTGFWTTWVLKLNYQVMRAVRGPRWFRRVLEILLVPLFLPDQLGALLLDALARNEGETASHTVTARKLEPALGAED